MRLSQSLMRGLMMCAAAWPLLAPASTPCTDPQSIGCSFDVDEGWIVTGSKTAPAAPDPAESNAYQPPKEVTDYDVANSPWRKKIEAQDAAKVRAAELDHQGYLAFHGESVPQDNQRAHDLFKEACEISDNYVGCGNLAWMIFNFPETDHPSGPPSGWGNWQPNQRDALSWADKGCLSDDQWACQMYTTMQDQLGIPHN